MKFVSSAILTVLVSGCATQANLDGIKITAEDRAICAQTLDCTVWSQAELLELARQIFQRAVDTVTKSRV